MKRWFLEPRDPLVIRDGRPNDERSESATMAFLQPSTCAGIVRTRLGSTNDGRFVLGTDQLEALRQTRLRGPLLADPRAEAPMFPRPRDLRLERGPDDKLRVRTLKPYATPAGIEHADLEGLSLVGPEADERARPGKPPREVPEFWPWSTIERGLRGELPREDSATAEWLGDGVVSLPREARTHVALDPETTTAREGMLYGTTGLRFAAGTAAQLSGVRELALFVDFDATPLQERTIAPGLGPMGGKRRLVRWRPATSTRLPAVPAWLEEHVQQAPETAPLRLRVTLATPAIFGQGYRPTSGESPLLPPFAKLIAALVPTPETISGWDFEHGRPKPSRRMAAAGSVFWIELGGDLAARLAWLQGVWMQNVSDHEQDRRDGFGLALVGVGT
ncbi:MAG: type III-B CRISPR module-associated protein Cmr3 [Kofleriaceae bacterium]